MERIELGVSFFDFREFVDDLIKRHSLSRRTMGEYLRALWKEIIDHKHDTVTYALLAHLIESAYVVDPLPFNWDWLNMEPLSWAWDRDSGTYIIEGFDKTARKRVVLERNIDPFRILEHTILSQISERYVLENAPESVTEKRLRSLRNDWSNPAPYPYLQTAMHVLYNTEAGQPEHIRLPDWAELAAILSIGQVYD